MAAEFNRQNALRPFVRVVRGFLLLVPESNRVQGVALPQLIGVASSG